MHAPAGEHDVSARFVELLGDLTSGLAAADDQHRAGRELVRVAVALDVDPQDVVGERRRSRGPMRPLVRARRKHDARRVERSLRRLQHEAAARARTHRRHRDALAHRRVEAPGIPPEESHDVVAWHEPVRIVAVVGAARKPHGPVRSHETEAVPASAPRFADAPALEHDVVDARLRQLVARRQARLARTDDDDDVGVHSLQSTFT